MTTKKIYWRVRLLILTALGQTEETFLTVPAVDSAAALSAAEYVANANHPTAQRVTPMDAEQLPEEEQVFLNAQMRLFD